MGASPSGPMSGSPMSSPHFFARCLPVTTLPLYPGLGHAPNMLACIPSGVVILSNSNNTTTTVLWPFVWDYPGEPVPEETLTHPPSWSSSNLYQLLPSTSIHSILPVQITCLAIFLHNLSPCPLWSTSWSGASASYSIHFFTQSVSSFRSTCPYHQNLFCCSINIISSIPSLSLNSLLGILSFTLTLHIHLTIVISARWNATSFSFIGG